MSDGFGVERAQCRTLKRLGPRGFVSRFNLYFFLKEAPLPAIDYSKPARSKQTHHKSRHIARLSSIPVFGRSKLLSRIQSVAAQSAPGRRYPQMMAFLEVSKWLVPYFRDVFHKNARYRTYPTGESGVFAAGLPRSELRVAVAADWGTGTLESEQVAANIKAGKPHFTLHLGDVYHLGDAQEIEENCLGQTTKNYGGVAWPLGSRGSFALMGNHEMYSGGQGYYERFLPKLGLLHADGTVKSQQYAGYFCLEAEHWILLGLDTGYHSGGIPLLGVIPGVNTIPALNVDARFDDKMLKWLKKTMDALQPKTGAKKTLIVMTHHQPLSSFEQYYTKPAQQLADLGILEGQEFVWLYGHEHRLTVYKKQEVVDGLVAYPRCIGHGGMPVSVSKLKKPDDKVLYYDPRVHAIDVDHPKTKVGYNGHLMLTIEGDRLTIEYHDIVKNRVLLTETFRRGQRGGLEHMCSKAAERGLKTGR